jgi:hypothetical protein
LEFFLQVCYTTFVHHVRIMLQIKRNIITVRCEENCFFVQSVGIANFIEDICVLAGHARYNQISLRYLIIDSFQNTLMENLLVNTFAISARISTRRLYPHFIDVAEGGVERHKHEHELLRSGVGQGG